MPSESPSLLLLLTVAAVGTMPVTLVQAKQVSPNQQLDKGIMEALRASVEQRLGAAGLPVLEPGPPSENGSKLAQYYNFPNFPNYFRNCFSGNWRNC
jgi:hypothetical protein